jgi:YidC/Oxa1 family membrane protein insertase
MIFASVIENAFGPLIKAFEVVLVFIHNDILGGGPGGARWGWSIIGLTIAVRLVLFPLFMRQMQSIRKLQLHMPEMKQIQEKYKDDRQRQSEELMKFYREKNINPLASCLPLVLQIPVLFSLYYMLRTDLKKHICGEELIAHYNSLHHLTGTPRAIETAAHLPSKYLGNTSCEQVAHHSASFLFIPDLTSKATGLSLAVLLVLYVVTMLGSSLLSSATADRNQRLMAIMLPLVFTVIIVAFPAGLLVYWISTNLWTIGQGYMVRRSMPPPPKAAAAGAGKAGGAAAAASAAGGGDGQLAARLRSALGGSATPAPAAEENAGVNGAGKITPPPPPRRRKRRRSGRRR